MPLQPTQGEFDYGQEALQKYPGFKRSYPQGVRVMDAGQDRIKAAPQWTTNRVSEFYNAGESGGIDMLPNPTNGSTPAIEIYNKDFTSANPANKKELVVGELLHGMKKDPKWSAMRKDFANSFTTDQVQLQKRGMTNNKTDFYSETPGETHQQMMERSGTDAYIRAHFMPNQPGSADWKRGYSPKQRQIIYQMENYLKTDPAAPVPVAQRQIDRALQNRRK